jgi:hypothetical protein
MTTMRGLSRRSLVGAAGALALADVGASDVPAPVRRIVTREVAAGSGRVVFRDAELQTVTLNGSRITRLWETPGVPVDLHAEIDAGAAAGNAYREGFAGTSLYVAQIPAAGEGAFVPMHQQDSLDYIAVLSGEIWLLLDGEELQLRAGDVLVQAGNTHGWHNRGDVDLPAAGRGAESHGIRWARRKCPGTCRLALKAAFRSIVAANPAGTNSLTNRPSRSRRYIALNSASSWPRYFSTNVRFPGG